MRPPDLPGGNVLAIVILRGLIICASMRPPDLPGGNPIRRLTCALSMARFNEAAGFTRRKPAKVAPSAAAPPAGFNEAAGFTRRKPVSAGHHPARTHRASMRPPDLPGGNGRPSRPRCAPRSAASMRPPDLPGGNPVQGCREGRQEGRASMRPPDLPGGNISRCVPKTSATVLQ